MGHLWGRCGTPGQGLPFKTPCWMCGNLDPERSLFPRPQRGRGQEARPEQAGPDPRLPSLGHCVLVVGVGRPEAARIEKGAAPQSLSPQDASKSVYGKWQGHVGLEGARSQSPCPRVPLSSLSSWDRAARPLLGARPKDRLLDSPPCFGTKFVHVKGGQTVRVGTCVGRCHRERQAGQSPPGRSKSPRSPARQRARSPRRLPEHPAPARRGAAARPWRRERSPDRARSPV